MGEANVLVDIINRFVEFRKTVVLSVLKTDMTYHFDILQLFIAQKDKKEELNANQKIDFIGGFLHLADISNPTRPNQVAIKWAKMHTEEQYIIGDKRRDLGLPLLINMERDQNKIEKNQMGFMDFVVKPIIKEVNGLLDMSQQLENLNYNYQYWKNISSQCK